LSDTVNHPAHYGGADTDVSLQLCPACGGEGHELVTIQVYELGCGFSHPDTVYGDRCDECDGTGGALVPVEPVDFEEIPFSKLTDDDSRWVPETAPDDRIYPSQGAVI
jgi:hypothetical protein